MANKYMQRCSTSYAIREIQVKTMRYCYTPITITYLVQNSKTLYSPNTGEDVEQQKPSFVAGGYVK